MKVLLMAYECSPYRGSEWAVGWGRLLQAARICEPHVITSEDNFAALERARAEGLVPANVRFYTPQPDAKLRRMERKPGLFAYNYAVYNHWQRLAFALATELHASECFALVHQVNVCTFREPGYAWQLGIPFLWGPVGGTQNVPWRFLASLGLVEGFKEGARGMSNWLSLRYKPRVRAAARAAAVVIGANSTNQRDYERVFRRNVQLLLETGLHRVAGSDRSPSVTRADIPAVVAAAKGSATKSFNGTAASLPSNTQGDGGSRVLQSLSPAASTPRLRILWSGELQSRKALPILLRALALLEDLPLELRVVGDGPMRQRWSALAEKLGLGARVEFMGRLPFADAVTQMPWADLFAFTSLRDTSGNVVLEALAAGVPVVCFNHQGAGDMVTAGCGVKIGVRSPVVAIEDFAFAIRAFATDGLRRLRLSEGARERAREFLWDRNGDRVNALYKELGERALARGGVIVEERGSKG